MIECENCLTESPDDEPEMMDVDGQTFCCWACVIDFGQTAVHEDWMTHEGAVAAGRRRDARRAAILDPGT